MGPGKHYREGVTVMEMAEMFGTEEKAVEWFEGLHWPDGVQRQRGELVPVAEALADLPGPVQALIPSPPTQRHFTLADQDRQALGADPGRPDPQSHAGASKYRPVSEVCASRRPCDRDLSRREVEGVFVLLTVHAPSAWDCGSGSGVV